MTSDQLEDLKLFNQAAESITHLRQNPKEHELMEIYALYKQTIIGDINCSRPGIFDPKGKVKWDAWAKLKGMSREDAKITYITKANVLVQKYG